MDYKKDSVPSKSILQRTENFFRGAANSMSFSLADVLAGSIITVKQGGGWNALKKNVYNELKQTASPDGDIAAGKVSGLVGLGLMGLGPVVSTGRVVPQVAAIPIGAAVGYADLTLPSAVKDKLKPAADSRLPNGKPAQPNVP